jgi:long-chain acyl-CoA synthetase
MSLATLLAAAARTWGTRPAVAIGDRVLMDYAGLARAAAEVAGGLARLGLRPGDPVVLWLANRPDYLALLFGCWWGGFVVVPVNARLHPREVAGIASDCRAGLVLAEAPVEAACRVLAPGELPAAEPAIRAAVAPEALAWLFYTSGTTGRPKGAMLSHRNLLAMAISYLADVDALTPGDALLHLAAQSHASGLFALSFAARGAANVLPPSGGYDPGELATLIACWPNLSFFAPPTLLRRMAEAPALRAAPLGTVRTVLTGAMPVLAEDIRAALGLFGPKLWNGYGQGESPCTITAMPKPQLAEAAAAGDEARMVSVGIARTGMEVIVADAAGRELPPGEVGEVRVRGETVMAGYLGMAEATAAALDRGWLRTGDLGAMDAQGFLTLLDRSKDLVISGGLNVYPREVEAVLAAVPGVAEVAVVGTPHPEWGEEVVAFVVPAAGAAPAPEALDAACLAAIARFKRPRRYLFVDSLPRNAVGKVLKRELRSRLGQDRTGP